MNHSNNNKDTVSHLKLLSNHPVFSAFEDEDLIALINESTIHHFTADEILIHEGELIDSILFIIEGKCEVRKKIKMSGEVQPIATLIKGESIGLSDFGLFSTTGLRTAQVAAITNVTVLRLDIEEFRHFIKTQEELNIFSAQLDALKRMHFIKAVAPFTPLTNESIRIFIDKIEEVSFPANTVLFSQGDIGDYCYIIISGKVEIAINMDDGSVKNVAELEANTVFGESALILDSPRNATALTIEPVTLLRINKSLFREIMQHKVDVAEALIKLQLNRSRPIRLNDIVIYTQKNVENGNSAILKNDKLGKYFQLSEEGVFIWELLDGKTSINDITIEYFFRYHSFNPEAIFSFVYSLYDAGFIHLDIKEDEKSRLNKTPKWLNVFLKLTAFLHFRISFGQADEWISSFYNKFIWLFYTKPAQCLWALIAMVGLASFIMHFQSSIIVLASTPYKWIYFCISLFAVALTIPLHELAHAFTTKYYGHKVRCFGIGWLWLGPFAFCDTSDMWVSPKKQRVIVDLVGLYLNAILAGMAGLLAFFTAAAYPEITLYLELFALFSYLLIITNLSPALELDGYYALMDLLDKPNLRISTIKWLVAIFSSTDKNKEPILKSLKSNYKELIYCLATLLFIFAIGTTVPYLVFKYLLHGLFGISNPFISITLVILAVIVSLFSIYKEIRKYS